MAKREIPQFTTPIIETHCHLDYLKDRPLEETLEICLKGGVDRLITISVQPGNLATVRELVETHPYIYGTQGIHPHEAIQWSDEVEEEIRKHAPHPKIVAVGEIGLDFHYTRSPRDKQIEVFKKQLALARELKKPVVIHSREAEKETIEILDEVKDAQAQTGVVHSFTSGLDLAEKAIELGYYLGFNGIITFKNAEAVRDAVRLCPLDRILLETDSPFLTPVPYRGRENAPFYLPFVAEKVAEIKGVSVDDCLKTTRENALKLFFNE